MFFHSACGGIDGLLEHRHGVNVAYLDIKNSEKGPKRPKEHVKEIVRVRSEVEFRFRLP